MILLTLSRLWGWGNEHVFQNQKQEFVDLPLTPHHQPSPPASLHLASPPLLKDNLNYKMTNSLKYNNIYLFSLLFFTLKGFQTF